MSNTTKTIIAIIIAIIATIILFFKMPYASGSPMPICIGIFIGAVVRIALGETKKK